MITISSETDDSGPSKCNYSNLESDCALLWHFKKEAIYGPEMQLQKSIVNTKQLERLNTLFFLNLQCLSWKNSESVIRNSNQIKKLPWNRAGKWSLSHFIKKICKSLLDILWGLWSILTFKRCSVELTNYIYVQSNLRITS